MTDKPVMSWGRRNGIVQRHENVEASRSRTAVILSCCWYGRFPTANIKNRPERVRPDGVDFGQSKAHELTRGRRGENKLGRVGIIRGG